MIHPCASGACRLTEVEDHIVRLEKELDEEREKRFEGNMLNSIELAESQKNDMYAMKLLAESQAREAKLRDFIFDYVDVEPNNERMLARYDTCVKPTDDTALREALKAEREKCAKVCDQHTWAADAGNAIRAMED